MREGENYSRLRQFVCDGSEFRGFSRESSVGHTIRVFRQHTVTLLAEDRTEASKVFLKLCPVGTRLESVQGEMVDGHCECCEAPIFEGEERSEDREGVMVCGECIPEPDDNWG